MDSQGKTFGEIALSLSGGGYRAAAFHLGTLDMLHELGLLADVTALSTVSGGSIAGVTFAAAMAEGLSFEQFKQKLYDFLRETNVITEALSGLQNSVEINGSRAMPSLIRAAAGVYASDELLGNRTVGFLLNKKLSLGEFAFNATDFRTGNSFRFQISTSEDVRSGNNAAEINPDINGSIRLADIVAASSCFPSGFEPLRFPSDFVWSEEPGLAGVRQDLGPKFAEDIPLMDGGIFDNQGIDSIKNICQRKDSDIGLYIISDTSQRDSSLLEFPAVEKSGRISLSIWYIVVASVFVCSILTMVAVATDFVASLLYGQLTIFRGVALYLIPFSFSLGVFFLILYTRYRIKKAEQLLFEKTGLALWKHIKRLSIPEIMELVDSRLKSVLVLTSTVFMRRIRALGFTSVFADPKLNAKLVPNLIYDLDNEERWGKEIVSRKFEPGEKLRAIACNAESYSTNLWFLDSRDLNNLIECGRATMCFKILKYLLRQRPVEIADPNTPGFQLFEKNKKIWLELNNGGSSS